MTTTTGTTTRTTRALLRSVRGWRNLAMMAALWLLGGGVAHALDYNGWWWNPDQSGQGINVGHQGNVMFIAWFTYDETGKGAWLVMGGPLTTPTTLSGNLTRTRGPALGTPFNPALVTGTTVGSATLTFSDLHHAALAWTFNGKSGTLPLVRESYGTTTGNGAYGEGAGSSTAVTANASCAYTGPTAAGTAAFTVTTDATTLTIDQVAPNTAHFQGAYQQSGEWLYVREGSYTAADAYGGGTFSASVLGIGRTVIVKLEQKPASRPGCVLSRTFTGLY